MGKHTDNSFGAKLRRGRDMAAAILGFDGYAPPREEENVDGFTNLLQQIEVLNMDLTRSRLEYKYAVDTRYAVYRKDKNCIEKLPTQIRGAVEAQYGKKSTEFILSMEAIKKMRRVKLIRPVGDLNSDETAVISEGSHSRSHQSYGDLIQYFKELCNHLSHFNNYFPSNPNIQVDNLQNLISNVDSLNDKVMITFQPYKKSIVERKSAYDDLNERKQRIKQYVKSHYGYNSKEYKLIKGL